MNRREPTLISSVQRALRLLDAVSLADRPVPAKKLAAATGQALPTTYHLLRTLVYEGYLTRVDDGYLLGDRLTSLTDRSRGQKIATRVRPTLRILHEELGVASYLSSYENGEISILDVVDSPSAPRVDLWVGFHDAGHATAVGKSILACLPEEDRKDYLSRHQLSDLTPNTITNRRALLEHLHRQRTYALDKGEYAIGTACLATPVQLPGHTGAVAVSLPTRRLPEVLDHRQALTRAARRIELALATADA
ncbi:MAG TPA: IclR family transcriptional regulator [Actinopolymorphaceae bacterium]